MNKHEVTSIIKIENVYKHFRKGKKQALPVLENINFEMKPGEIVALLGKSGSGKSTLMRIMSGLLEPSQGAVYYRGEQVKETMFGISMVFQSFALMPWLTVLQNVELGLEAQGLDIKTRRKRALKAIDTIGLDGFESAFPKELSGGMRQRVGFARALVVNPDILLMDEPFSSLDVLTAENLKNDLLDLWHTKKTRLNGIFLVTHNIEEAVHMADRIIIFDSDPGRIKTELLVDLPRPRNDQEPAFRSMVDRIYTLMTTREVSANEAHSLAASASATVAGSSVSTPISIGFRLPEAEVSELIGLIETVNAPEHQGKMDLPKLAELVHLDIDDLFPLTEVLEIMNFAKISQGDIATTADGKAFAEADLLARKHIFSKHLVTYVPLAQHIRTQLDSDYRHQVSEEVFIRELSEFLSEKEAHRVLTTIIDWGRYAELFAYDYNTGMLSLENPGESN